MSIPTHVTRVYIAVPRNDDNLLDVAGILETLIQRRYAVYFPVRADRWQPSNVAFLRVCDVVCRLNGICSIADSEVSEAHQVHVPVVYGLEGVWKYANTQPNRMREDIETVPAWIAELGTQTAAKLNVSVQDYCFACGRVIAPSEDHRWCRGVA